MESQFPVFYRVLPNDTQSAAEPRKEETFYKGRRDLPIVPSHVIKSAKNDEVLKLLLNAPKTHRSIITSSNPVGIQNNVTFIVDLDSLGDPEDLLSDDLGAWEQTKTRSKWYLVKFKTNGEVCDVTKVEDKLHDSYQVCRRPYINKSDRSLRKTVVNVIHPDGHHHSLVFVKYHFEGTKEHPIDVKPHGNSTKCSIPYLRTYRSTICKLKDTVAKQHSGLKRTIHDVEKAVGGLEFCNSKGALPRGERQASYINNTSNEKVLDPILDITQKMKMESERGAEKFVRCYSLDDDSPKVVLFTDDQVDDLVNFCCNGAPGHKSLLYVDVTFQLGPFLCS